MAKNVMRARVIIFVLLILGAFTSNTFCVDSIVIEPFDLKKSDFDYSQVIEYVFKYYLSFLGENVSYMVVPRGVIISINNDVFFEGDNVELSDYSKQVLLIIGELLKFVDKQCVVEANSQILNLNDTIYNSHWEISTARADSIIKYLVNEINVPPYKIRSIGFGDKIPYYKDAIEIPQMSQRMDFVVLNYEKFRQ